MWLVDLPYSLLLTVSLCTGSEDENSRVEEVRPSYVRDCRDLVVFEQLIRVLQHLKRGRSLQLERGGVSDNHVYRTILQNRRLRPKYRWKSAFGTEKMWLLYNDFIIP